MKQLSIMDQKYSIKIVDELNMALRLDTENPHSVRPKRKITLNVSDILIQTELGLIKEVNKSLALSKEEKMQQSHEKWERLEKRALVQDFVEVRMTPDRELLEVLVTPAGVFGFSRSNGKMISRLNMNFDSDHEIIFKQSSSSFVLTEKGKAYLSINLSEQQFVDWQNKLKQLQRKLAKSRVKEVYKCTLGIEETGRPESNRKKPKTAGRKKRTSRPFVW